jgi:hypothetical protein
VLRAFQEEVKGRVLLLKKIYLTACFLVSSSLFASLEDQETLIKSPLPACVKAIFLKEIGTPFKKGEPLFILECMKMEMKICAPRDGVVGSLFVKEGEIVAAYQTLLDSAAEKEALRNKEPEHLLSPHAPHKEGLSQLEGEALSKARRMSPKEGLARLKNRDRTLLENPENDLNHEGPMDAVIHPHDPGGPGGIANACLLAEPQDVTPLAQAPLLSRGVPTPVLAKGAVEPDVAPLVFPQIEKAPLPDATPLGLSENQPMLATTAPSLGEVSPMPPVLSALPVTLKENSAHVLREVAPQKEELIKQQQDLAPLAQAPLLSRGVPTPVLAKEAVEPDASPLVFPQIEKAPLPDASPLGVLENQPMLAIADPSLGEVSPVQGVMHAVPLSPKGQGGEFTPPLTLQNKISKTFDYDALPLGPLSVFENGMAMPILEHKTPTTCALQIPDVTRIYPLLNSLFASHIPALMTHMWAVSGDFMVLERLDLRSLDKEIMAASFYHPFKIVLEENAVEAAGFNERAKEISQYSTVSRSRAESPFPQLIAKGNTLHVKAEMTASSAVNLKAALISAQEADEMKDVLAQSWRSLKDLGSTPLGILCLALAGLLAMLPSPVGVDWQIVARSLRVSYTLMKASSALPALRSVRVPLQMMNR